MLPFIDARPLCATIMAQARLRLTKVRPRTARVISLRFAGTEEGEHRNAAERHAERVAASMGLGWGTRLLNPNTRPEELFQAVASLNLDPDVVGIVIARPVPDNLSLRELHQSLHPLKDVEGMHPNNIGLVVYGRSSNFGIYQQQQTQQTEQASGGGERRWENGMLPCTATASVELLRFALGKSLQGLEALVVGNSDVLAKPVCSLLHASGATVSIIPSDNPKLPAFTRAADVVFLAVSNRPNFVLTGDMLKPGCSLIDIGFNVVEETGGDGKKKRRIVGDADLDSCLGIVEHVCTISRGIGLVRNAILFDNISRAVAMARNNW